MEEKANSAALTATQQPPPRPSTVEKARMVRAAPSAEEVSRTPEQQMARPVTVQTTMVSKKTPVMWM